MAMFGPPIEPGAQVANFSLALANNEVSRALFLLTDAMVRIANGTPDPRHVADLTIELINAAIPVATPAATTTDTPSGEPPAT